ncbi:MAG: alpha-amylase family glycosyl hydrolase [Muribaculaceae bacterium]|nr:alpha-amylase family glycosyl hydrolase [Muribaculaceae bacterium]
MFYKRVMAVLLSAALTVSLAACGTKPAEQEEPVAEQQESEEKEDDVAEAEPADEAGEESEEVSQEVEPWAREAVFYQIFVRSFYDGNGDGIGDFQGITKNIEYLKELGADAIWLMPMFESSTYHGYDVVDYYNVEQDYGTMEDFQELVDVCHENDIRIILDFVVNHTSSYNEWFRDALSNPESEYRDYYLIQDTEPEDASMWWQDEETGMYYYGHYDSIMPDLNYDNEAVHEKIKDVAGFWLDKGVDGFRLDGSNNIDEENESATHAWWQEFTGYVKEKNPEAFIVGENWYSNTQSIAPYYGDMYSSFDFPLCDKIANMTGGSQTDVVSLLADTHESYAAAAEGSGGLVSYFADSTMIGNHDMDRIATRAGSQENARLAAALLMTLPGTPFIYYGDELGQYGQSPDGNRREPFDWYASAEGEGMTVMQGTYFDNMIYTVGGDGISYEEEAADENSMFHYYKKLIAIRKENPMLFYGNYETIGFKEGAYAYTVTDETSSNRLLVIHALREDVSFTLGSAGKDLLAGTEYGAGDTITLPSKNTLILQCEAEGELLSADEFSTDISEGEYTITVSVTLPENTPMDENVYIVGTFNDWNECDENYIMTRTSETACEIELTAEAYSSMEYKFTRGSWDMREQNAAGEDLVGPLQKQNREYTFESDGDVLECTIDKWSDL